MKESSMKYFWLCIILGSFHYAWSSQCEITMEPNGTRSFLLGDYFNLICHANDDCYLKMSVYENGTEGNFYKTWCLPQSTGNLANCTGNISIEENFLHLTCVGYKFDNTRVNSSTSLLLQVQNTLESVNGNLVVRLGDNATLNTSWNPVLAYQGLDVYYNITFNETVYTTSNTTMILSTSGMDECQFASIFVKPFIKTTNQILNGTTKQWNISIAIPPMISKQNYTLMMRKNKSVVIDVFIEFNLTDCDCPGRTNEVVVILKNDTFSYFNAAPLILDTADTCDGLATFILPPCISFEAEIILENGVGSNVEKRMYIDMNALKDVNYTNGSITCYFTDKVMITNNYSTGCVVYYANMSKPVYAMRDNDTATVNITDINSSGYYIINVIPLPFPVRYLSVNINVKPSTTSTTASTVCTTATVTVLKTVEVPLPASSTSRYETCLQTLYIVVGISIKVLWLLVGCVAICFSVKCYNRRQRHENLNIDGKRQKEKGNRRQKQEVEKETAERNQKAETEMITIKLVTPVSTQNDELVTKTGQIEYYEQSRDSTMSSSKIPSKTSESAYLSFGIGGDSSSVYEYHSSVQESHDQNTSSTV